MGAPGLLLSLTGGRYPTKRMRTNLLRAAPLLALAVAVLASGCLFDSGEPTASANRPRSIPTATLPPTLPEPMALGESQAATGRPTGAATGGENTYVIKSGDTLYGIAAAMGIPSAQQAAWVAEVLRLNNIVDVTGLFAGQEIRVPRPSTTPTPTGTARSSGTPTATSRATTPTPGSTAAATPRPTTAPTGRTYTVESGDYPLLIAQKLNVPEAQRAAWVQELISLNNIDPSRLSVGQVLQLPGSTP